MGKIIGGILGTLAIAGLVLFLLFHFGVLSFGKGDGNGDVLEGYLRNWNRRT